MKGQQIAYNKENLYYVYNKSFDILNIYIIKNIVAVSEEIESGVYLHFDVKDDTIVGITIEDYKLRKDWEKINDSLPIRLDFNYINSKIKE